MTSDKGAVACGHPITAEAAAEVLCDGGNAFDAVIAGFFAACAAEPALASMGGGGYLLARAAGREPVVYDFFAQTPLRSASRGILDFHPIHADFGTTTQEFHIGLGAVATPGAVRGALAIHRDLCSLPMTRLLEPAVRAAREGFTVDRLQSGIFDIIRPIFQATPEVAGIYASATHSGLLVREGETLRQEALAGTFEALALDGEALFYEGEIGARIAALCEEGGGLLEREDLVSYRVERRSPLAIEYRGARLLTNPPPAAGGILIAFALELLQACDLGAVAFGGADHLDLLARVMELTNQRRVDLLACSRPEEVLGLLDDAYLERYRNQVLGRSACRRGTTHISVIDAAGNVAAMTVSNGEGCGHHVPGTGVMLNNMLGEEDINPRGFHRWQPGERMSSMMSPSLLLLPEARQVALGSGGSNRIRTAVLQVVSNLVDFGMSSAQAVAAPRMHHERGQLSVEPGYPERELERLFVAYPDHKRWENLNLFFGGVHTVEIDQGTFVAAGDPRRGGIGKVVT